MIIILEFSQPSSPRERKVKVIADQRIEWGKEKEKKRKLYEKKNEVKKRPHHSRE